MEEIETIRQKMRQLADARKAETVKRYMKSNYAFYGISVPNLRKIAKETAQNSGLSIYDIYNLFDELWNSGNHEEMSVAAFLLQNFKKDMNMGMWKFLFENAKIEKAKSWDHIDDISSHITGVIFLNNPMLQHEIKSLAGSRNSWMRRLAIVSQYPLIKKGKIQLALLLAEKLCYDDDIYVQKGTGWMLREAGKKNPVQVQEFLRIHSSMKPACFSYATEKMVGFRKMIKEKLKAEKDKGESIEKTDEEKKRDALQKIKYFRN